MRKIAELNMLLRTRTELPIGLEFTTDEFREGWSFVRQSNARRLEKKIVMRGWNFIRIADGSLRSGVGDTSQEAIASALKLALRRISTHFNAVEVERIELTQYPWFFLARVRVYPYRIQHGATLVAMSDMVSDSVFSESRSLADGVAALAPQFGCAMPMLKEMLVSSKISESKAA